MKLAVSLVKDVLPKLATSSTLDRFKRKINARRALRAGNGFTLFNSNKDMNNIMKIVKSLETILIYGATQTVKHEMRKQEVGVLPPLMALKVASLITSMASLLIKPMVSPFLKGIFGKGVSKTQTGGILTLLAAALFLKTISGK